MSINLAKNQAQILDAWTKVSKNEDGYDWALFGYEGKSLELKVVSGVDGSVAIKKKRKLWKLKNSSLIRRKRLVLVELIPLLKN